MAHLTHLCCFLPLLVEAEQSSNFQTLFCSLKKVWPLVNFSSRSLPQTLLFCLLLGSFKQFQVLVYHLVWLPFDDWLLISLNFPVVMPPRMAELVIPDLI